LTLLPLSPLSATMQPAFAGVAQKPALLYRFQTSFPGVISDVTKKVRSSATSVPGGVVAWPWYNGGVPLGTTEQVATEVGMQTGYSFAGVARCALVIFGMLTHVLR
jgi:hypothetical protein